MLKPITRKHYAIMINGMVEMQDKVLKDLQVEPMTVRDFDRFTSGIISGISIVQEEIEEKDIQEIMELVLEMSAAQNLKITGTEKEAVVKTKIY